MTLLSQLTDTITDSLRRAAPTICDARCTKRLECYQDPFCLLDLLQQQWMHFMHSLHLVTRAPNWPDVVEAKSQTEL